MNDTDDHTTKFDKPKWTVVWIIILAGIIANFYFSNQILAIRLVGWLLLIILAGLVASQTQKGRQAVEFVREAQMEMRKVTWPSRQETVQTTLIVMLMVVITALILWVADSILLWLISFLTGQRG